MSWRCERCGTHYDDVVPASQLFTEDRRRRLGNSTTGTCSCGGALVSGRSRPEPRPEPVPKGTVVPKPEDLPWLDKRKGVSWNGEPRVHLRVPEVRGVAHSTLPTCNVKMPEVWQPELAYPAPGTSWANYVVCKKCYDIAALAAGVAKDATPERPLEVEVKFDPVAKHVEQMTDDQKHAVVLKLCQRIAADPDGEWLVAQLTAMKWEQAKTEDGRELRYVNIVLILASTKADPTLGLEEKGEADTAMETRYKMLEPY